MKKITELTEYQKSQMKPWANKWIEIGLRTGDMDLESFTEGAKIAYEKAELPWHNKIIIVDNPIIMALAAPIADFILKGKDVGYAVGGAVDDAIGDAIGDTIGGAIRGAVSDAVGYAIRGAVSDAVDAIATIATIDAIGDAIGDAVGDVSDAVGDAVRNAVSDAVSDAVFCDVNGVVKNNDLKKYIINNYHNYMGGQFWVGGWYWGNAYVTYFRDVCGLELTPDILQRMDAYEKINTSACMWYPTNNFIIVSKRPDYINRDAEGLLHSETQASIHWTGFELFYWHGVKVPKNWIVDKTLTAKEALSQTNTELRRAACEILGWAKILKELDAKVIDKEDDELLGELIEVNLPGHGNQRFLRVRCGTGREFAMRTSNKFTTVLEAQAAMRKQSVSEFKIPAMRT